MYSGRGRPPKGIGNVILQTDGGGESSGDEDDEPAIAAMTVVDSEMEDKYKEYSEEETDEEVRLFAQKYPRYYLLTCS